MTINERWARAMLSHLTEPGDAEVGQLVAERGPADAVEHLYYAHASRLAERLSPRWPRPITLEQLEHWYIATLTRPKLAMRFVVPGDDEWPTALNNLGVHAPFGLWVRGNTDALYQLNVKPSVAIVGARAATSYGEHVAMELAAELAGRDILVVSGAAYGIDGAAHRAVLAAGGVTIAFLAGGSDRPYPMGHSELIGRITDKGAVVSEVPPGSSPTKWRFLQRNRLIAAASHGTVVVEAGWRSGSLNTAGHALALGRPLGAVPGPITSAASNGCHRILREMGGVCITSTDDVVDLISPPQGDAWHRAEVPGDELFPIKPGYRVVEQ